MPSNQTTNYQLSQWVKSDQVKMEDFNADNAKLDAALAAHAAALAGKGNCRVETVTYTGASQDGEGLSKRIPFSAQPAFVAIIGEDSSFMAMAAGGTKAFFAGRISAATNYSHGCPKFYWNGDAIVLTDFFVQSRMDASGVKYQATAWIPAS